MIPWSSSWPDHQTRATEMHMMGNSSSAFDHRDPDSNPPSLDSDPLQDFGDERIFS